MLIGQILASKGTDVVATGPEATIAELAQMLKAHRIGAVVVTDAKGRLVGIISERDIARGLADHGAELPQRNVVDLMTRDVVTCRRDDGIEHLMSEMTRRRVRHLPVVEEGALVGMISIGDVVKYRLQELEAEAHSLQEYISNAR